MSEVRAVAGLSWKTEDVDASLAAVREYVESKALQQISWYYSRKKWKARMSIALRLLSIVFFTAGGLCPLFKAALKPDVTDQIPIISTFFDFGQLGYLLIAGGAACIAFDRFFGYSSGWMRYMTTAFSIEKSLEEFRFAWAALSAQAGSAAPGGDRLQQLLASARELSLAVNSQVEMETKAWIVEFQSNLAQLEKDLKERADASVVESKTLAEAARPGAISMTVTNGASADQGFTVELDGELVERDVAGNKYEILRVPPGIHKLQLRAAIQGVPARASEIVNVSSGAIVKVTLELVAAKTAGT